MQVLDHGYVTLRNLSGPTRRPNEDYDADDTDPANSARFSFDGADSACRSEAKVSSPWRASAMQKMGHRKRRAAPFGFCSGRDSNPHGPRSKGF